MRLRNSLTAVLTADATFVLAPVIAPAAATHPATDSAPDAGAFGQHVRDCAQGIGLSGDHDPGVHRGAAGWAGMPRS